MKIKTYCFSLAVMMLGYIGSVSAQGTPSQKSSGTYISSANGDESKSLVLRALRISKSNQITLDGKLDEGIWNRASTATGFIQRTPNDGAPASEKTEVKVIYTDDAVYVGARAYDSAMDSVAATLFRKDGGAYSDWFYANIDSYDDNRTGFSFAVNPRGVRKDILVFNDSNEDLKWDAVWEASTVIEDDHWSVEMKIPLSQLRFDADKVNQQWGINFQRRIARKGEISFWAPTPQNASGIVSKFGELKGISNLDQNSRLEVMPYLSGKLTRAPEEAGNPFYSSNDYMGSVGADVKYGLTSDLTLTATINPDFGQVEADPAVINLSANEVFYPEQRSFFLEGTDIFDFGNVRAYSRIGNPLVFYSRRIGRKPQGNVSQAGIDAKYVNRPEFTNIAGAAKLSGKTKNGLSIGAMNAFTLGESAEYRLDGNKSGSLLIEPPTNYFVGRMKQDLNEGSTTIGGYASAVNRVMNNDYLKGSLHESAYIAGLDFEQSWMDREWILSGTFSASSVNGSAESLKRTQLSSQRYYNRPDADYLSVDPNKTNMQGYAGGLAFGRFAGEHWLASVSYSITSPGYEVNDVGFGQRVDYQGMAYFLRYQENDPKGMFRSWNVALNKFHLWNFGGDQIEDGYNLLANAEFKNQWQLNLSSGMKRQTFDDRLLRGGPMAISPGDHFASLTLSTNEANRLSFGVGHLRGVDTEGGYRKNVFLNINYRPTSYVQLKLKPDYTVLRNTMQYVQSVADPLATETYSRRYIFANLDQETFSTTLRLDWTFTPNMSLQTYIRPYITSGDYSGYKEFKKPRSLEFMEYGTEGSTISKQNGSYEVDPDAAGPVQPFSLNDRDFNFRSVQSNIVFRWEYMPGSTLYLVWQQDRNAFARTGNFNLGRDMDQLFSAEPTNVFLVKLSYWFSK